jgi:signal transduction histidine kinase
MKDFVSPGIEKAFSRYSWQLAGVIVALLVIQSATLYFVLPIIAQNNSMILIVASIAIADIALMLVGFIVYSLADQLSSRIRQQTYDTVKDELQQLESTVRHAQALQAMASTLRATLSFDEVMEQALNVCSLALGEIGISGRDFVGAVFLYHGSSDLTPIATRGLNARDNNKTLEGKQGLIGEALTQAEAMITSNAATDPELSQIISFKNCATVVCIPLRAGFQIFGAMVLGTDRAVEFNKDHLILFNAVADHAVIALQNAQLYQNLEREKQRIIKADEDARKELARDLHDGPTQTIAAIAMRINFIRSLLSKNPEQALSELEKVEELAKQTSKEIRGMLFTLRPLVLETQGLSKALETVIKKLHDTDGLNVRMVGGDYGDMLIEQAQTVVFAIVEEALGNARKYSKANLIEVRMWHEDDLFVTRIQDDGVGFDAESVNKNYSSRGSLGLINMKERAERIDGSLKLDTEPGKGTTWTLVVPLQKYSRRVAAVR